MKNLLACVLSILVLNAEVSSQAPTFSKDIAPILYNNCTTCHHDGGIAPFNLESYADAYARGYQIKRAVETGIMPPWPPDVSYRSFLHERTLTQAEINTIVNWVDAGAPEGNPNMAPSVPNFPEGKILPGTPDLTLTLPVYESKADNVDEYACFSIPSGLTEDKFIKAIEVVPGNLAIVHHVVVFAADANITDCIMPIIAGQTLVGYAPGAPPTVFPSEDDLKLGMKLKAGSNIMLQIHYPEGTAGEWDSTSVNFYFYPDNETGIREVVSGPYVQNFIFPPIQPNTVQTVEGYYTFLNDTTFELGGTTGEDRSILAVFPHMHLIGKSIISYAVDAADDTIPLVNINDWDFAWQGFYFYENLIKITAGSRLLGHGVYDNTTNNHNNPYNPAQTITVGEATTDEMFLISYLSMKYEPGDEDYDLSSMMAMPVSADDHLPIEQTNIFISVYPNPTTGQFEISGWNASGDEGKTNVSVIDLLGKTVYTTQITGTTSPSHINIGKQADGLYFIHLKNNSRSVLQKMVVEQQ